MEQEPPDDEGDEEFIEKIVNARFGAEKDTPPPNWDIADNLESDEDNQDSDDEDFEGYSEVMLHPMDVTAQLDQDELTALKNTF